MMALTLGEIAAALDCPAPDADLSIGSVVTDSRQVRYGALFAALTGSRVDGHEFAPSAVGLGASALLVSRKLDLEVPQLVVDDVLRALGLIAALLRRRLDPVVIGITGSNGKTTVKEMLGSILRQQDEVLSTQGNYNNELGVPLSLFRLEEKHRYAVLELGASKAGDIAYLCDIAQPDVGLVTNAGPAHLQGFGDEQGVARAKGEIFASLPAGGWSVINGDQQWADQWREMSKAGNTISFGKHHSNDVHLMEQGPGHRLQTPDGILEFDLALPGRHNLLNAAAATAAALALGLPMSRIRAGLESTEPVQGRLNLLRTAAGWTVIDDTYNANPASLYSALQVLSGMQGKAWLVLGDMKELGHDSRKLHAEVGGAALALGVSRLFATGEMSAYTVDAFGEGAVHFENREALVQALLKELRPGVNCLVKGSRSMGMESVVEAIRSEADSPSAASTDLREAG
jgi:UDP-N-acetylmuramoyl-tripeptide--D-alanyl-D-alanine ligase